MIADPAGIARLQRLLQRLSDAANRGINDDAHLFAESWGGYDLNESPVVPGAVAIRQVDFRVQLSGKPYGHAAV